MRKERRNRFVTNELPLKITSQYTLIKSESISNGRRIYVLCCFMLASSSFCVLQFQWMNGENVEIMLKCWWGIFFLLLVYFSLRLWNQMAINKLGERNWAIYFIHVCLVLLYFVLKGEKLRWVNRRIFRQSQFLNPSRICEFIINSFWKAS